MTAIDSGLDGEAPEATFVQRYWTEIKLDASNNCLDASKNFWCMWV
ncbi:MAG: hypothetical protein KGZ61_04040 [Sandarakinorhabdus sp.]|nr:hypothetical protein [Sandarakinorhabdus sp.]